MKVSLYSDERVHAASYQNQGKYGQIFFKTRVDAASDGYRDWIGYGEALHLTIKIIVDHNMA